MTVRSLIGLLGSERRTTVRILLAALSVAAVCWYFGTDVWHSIMLGGVITTLGVIGLIGAALEIDSARWRGDEPSTRAGSRRDVAELSFALSGSYGRVGNGAVWRVRKLARQRLASHHLDLLDPADRGQIEQLIGRRAYAVLVRGERRPPLLRSLLRCLDALEALDALDAINPAAAGGPPPRARPLRRSWRFRGR